MERLADDARGDYLICLPDFTGAVDALANLRTTRILCFALYEHREGILSITAIQFTLGVSTPSALSMLPMLRINEPDTLKNATPRSKLRGIYAFLSPASGGADIGEHGVFRKPRRKRRGMIKFKGTKYRASLSVLLTKSHNWPKS